MAINTWNGQRMTHLSNYEALLWRKFLEEHGGKFSNYTYDVHLEKPINLPKDFPETYAESAKTLSAYRIDVVMQDTKTIYVVEIRPEAKQGAIGNLIFYRFLYLMQYNPKMPVQMILVTDLYAPAIELTCRAAGIGYFVY